MMNCFHYRKILFLLLLALFFKDSKAQKFYTFFTAGKNAAIGQEWYGRGNYIREKDGKTTESTFYYSLGAGQSATLGLGYKLNENFSAELLATYYQAEELYSHIKDESILMEAVLHIKGFAFWLAPSIKLNLPLSDKHSIYSRTSLIVGTGRFISEYRAYDNTNLFEMMYSGFGNVNVGMAGALGYNYSINSKLGIFAELGTTCFTYTPKRGKFLRYTVDGKDQLAGRTEDGREIDYVKVREYGMIGPDDDNNIQMTQEKFPVKNAGISLGIHFNL